MRLYQDGLSISEAEDLLDIVDRNRGEIVPCFIGAPGIGKTQTVYRWAEKRGRRVVEMILSQRLPTEISGLVMPDSETKSMEVFDHSRLASLQDGDILLLDELLEAPPMVLSACLTLIQERRLMSGKKLPDIMIVACTNPTATPVSLKMSIRQRFMWINIVFNEKEYKKYISDKHDIELDSRLLDMIDTESSKYNCLTPRTLDKLLGMMKHAKDGGSVDLTNKARMFVASMFDENISQLVYEAARKQTIDSRAFNAIKDTLAESGYLDSEERAVLNEMIKDKVEFGDILEYLSTCVRGEKIIELLSKVEI